MNARSKKFFGGRPKFLESRALLYFLFLISISNIILFGLYGNVNSVVVYLLSAFIISYFSKNMIVILTLSLVISNIHKYGIDYFIKKNSLEGMEDKEEEKEDFEGEGESEKPDFENEKDKEEFEGEKKTKEKFTDSTNKKSSSTIKEALGENEDIVSKLDLLIKQNDELTKKILSKEAENSK